MITIRNLILFSILCFFSSLSYSAQTTTQKTVDKQSSVWSKVKETRKYYIDQAGLFSRIVVYLKAMNAISQNTQYWPHVQKIFNGIGGGTMDSIKNGFDGIGGLIMDAGKTAAMWSAADGILILSGFCWHHLGF